MPKHIFFQRIYRLFFPLDFAKSRKWLPLLKQFDVVYSHQYPMTWLSYLAKRFYKIRYIYYDYGIAPAETFSNIFERLYIIAISRFTYWTISNADEVISISKYLQSELRKHVRLSGEVAYPKMDKERFNHCVDNFVREKYGLDNDPVVLYMGRISPHKGIDLLITAFKKIKLNIPSAKLIIVGKPTFYSYYNSLKKMSDESIVFAGYVPDEEIKSYYAACDVYATATLWEGFNLPLVEAQACGKPVIAFNIGPHPEVVENRKTGILVDVRDTEQFARAIIKILTDNNLRTEMGEAAVKMVREKFT